MKKLLSLILLLTVLLSLTACGDTSEKEGMMPYELSEKEQFLLESFGINSHNSQIISFNAPREAITLNVRIYRLGADGAWEETDGGGISLGVERSPVDTLSGVFAMELGDQYAMDFHINCGGLASYKTTGIVIPGQEILSSTRGFLQDFQSITLNTEIPVAVMVYDSGTTMQSYALEDFYEPSKFESMDLVQFVTLEFSNKEL